jgi:Secretion system C-terminal sorting domain
MKKRGWTVERAGKEQAVIAGKLQLSPNPARSEVRIDFAEFEAVSLHIYRLNGSVQYAQEGINHASTIQVQTQAWKPGTYFVKAQDATGAIRTSLLSVVK